MSDATHIESDNEWVWVGSEDQYDDATLNLRYRPDLGALRVIRWRKDGRRESSFIAGENFIALRDWFAGLTAPEEHVSEPSGKTAE